MLIYFVSGQIADMGIQMKALILGAAMAAIACTTIIALILSLANHQSLDQPYSTQVQKRSTVSCDVVLCRFLIDSVRSKSTLVGGIHQKLIFHVCWHWLWFI